MEPKTKTWAVPVDTSMPRTESIEDGDVPIMVEVPAAQYAQEARTAAEEMFEMQKTAKENMHQKKKDLQFTFDNLSTEIGSLQNDVASAGKNIAAIEKTLDADDSGKFGCFGSNQASREKAEIAKLESELGMFLAFIIRPLCS